MNAESKKRLCEIRSEMIDLLSEAKDILRRGDRPIHERAKAYWIGQIDAALGGGDYVDSMVSFVTTLNELGIKDPDEFDADAERDDYEG